MGVGIKYVGIKYGRLEVVETSEIGNIRCISVVTVGEEKSQVGSWESHFIGIGIRACQC